MNSVRILHVGQTTLQSVVEVLLYFIRAQSFGGHNSSIRLRALISRDEL